MRYLVAIAVLLYLLCGGPMAGRRPSPAARERVAGMVEQSGREVETRARGDGGLAKSARANLPLSAYREQSRAPRSPD